MKLRTYLILFSILIISASMGFLFFQTKNVLEAGFSQIQETKLSNISQLLLSLVESKKEELKNFSRAVRFNNDLSSAYVLSMETRDRRLVGDKLNKIQKDTGLDFIEILSLSGRPFLSGDKEGKKIKASIHSKKSGFGSILLDWQGKPVLAFYAPLGLYDQTVGILVVGTLLDKLPASEALKTMNADIRFTNEKFVPKALSVERQIQISPDDSDSTIYATVTLNKESEKMLEHSFSGKLLWLGPISLLLLVILIYVFLEFGFLRKFMDIVHSVQNYAASVTKGKVESLSLGKHYIREIDKLGGAFEGVTMALIQYERAFQEKIKIEEEMKKQKILTKLAQQVAHDIRSPLSSMNTALEYFGNLKSGEKQYPDYLNLLELSAKRLSSIADGLLLEHGKPNDKTKSFSPHRVLDELVGEYQNQGSFKNIRFVKKYHSQDFDLQGDSAKLQRAFGNIIKNAIEAMSDKGVITLATTLDNGTADIRIGDTGPGMNAEKLNKVLKGGYTEGKEDGHGIGMTVVWESIAEWGGILEAVSKEGEGTTFVIKLPISKKAESQQQILNLKVFPQEPVVIIDDEPSMREQWRLQLKDKNLQTLLCDSFEDFERQKITPQISKTAIVDYHFDNSELTGTKIISKLQKLGFQNLYLCTAEYWKPSVQKMAEELGVTLCPKPLPRITVEILPLCKGEVEGVDKSLPSPTPPLQREGGYHVLVVDDDQMIHMSWEMIQKKLGIAKLHSFESLEALKKEDSIDFAALDIAFVDKNIENSAFDGAQVIDFLKAKGVSKIVLASGESEKELREDPQFAQADFVISLKVPTSFTPFFS